MCLFWLLLDSVGFCLFCFCWCSGFCGCRLTFCSTAGCAVPIFSSGLVPCSVVFWSKSAPFFLGQNALRRISWPQIHLRRPPGCVWSQISESDNIAKRIKESLFEFVMHMHLNIHYYLLYRDIIGHITHKHTTVTIFVCLSVFWCDGPPTHDQF